MNKLISILLILLIVFIPFSSAYLTILEIKQVNLNKDTIQILAETNKDTYLLFIFKSKDSTILKNIYSNTLQEAYTSKYYGFNLDTSSLYKIELVSYSYVNNKIQLDTLTTTSYILTGKEKSTEPVQQQVQIEQVQNQVQETLPSKTSYIYSNNQLVAKKLNNQINYYHSDQISSTSIITDSSSNIVYKSDYLPFGSGFNEIGEEKYTYTSKEQDKYINLYYYGARYYDPSIGRFTQIDPIQDYSSSSYIYVDNNPLVKIDPSGKQAQGLPELPTRFTEASADETSVADPDLKNYFLQNTFLMGVASISIPTSIVVAPSVPPLLTAAATASVSAINNLAIQGWVRSTQYVADRAAQGGAIGTVYRGINYLLGRGFTPEGVPIAESTSEDIVRLSQRIESSTTVTQGGPIPMSTFTRSSNLPEYTGTWYNNAEGIVNAQFKFPNSGIPINIPMRSSDLIRLPQGRFTRFMSHQLASRFNPEIVKYMIGEISSRYQSYRYFLFTPF